RRLGHEVDAAEDDGRLVHLGRLAGQLEAVAGDVGQLLNLTLLIVVGEDDRVFAGLEGADFVDDVGHERGPCFVNRVAGSTHVTGDRAAARPLTVILSRRPLPSARAAWIMGRSNHLFGEDGTVGKVLCGVVALVLAAGGVRAQADKPAEERALADKATKLTQESEELFGQGKVKEAADKAAEALDLRRKLY